MENTNVNAPPQKSGSKKILIIIISSIILIVSLLGIGFTVNKFIFSNSTTFQKVDTDKLKKDSKELNDKMYQFVQNFIDKGETKSWNIDKSGTNPDLVRTQISNKIDVLTSIDITIYENYINDFKNLNDSYFKDNIDYQNHLENYKTILFEMKKTQQNAKVFRSDNENIANYINLIEVANKVIEYGYDYVINLIEYKLLPNDFKKFMKSLDDYYDSIDKVSDTNLKTKVSFSILDYEQE